MDEKILGFDEKLELLLAEAKKKKNVLENQEILDFFRDEILDPDKLDKIYDFLENNKVDVLRIGDDALCGPWNAVSRPDSGRKSGTHKGCGKVRLYKGI